MIQYYQTGRTRAYGTPGGIDAVTIWGPNKRMRSNSVKKIGISELKAHIARWLQWVRRGGVLTVTRRGEPVARVEPVPVKLGNGLVVWKATRKASEIRMPTPLRKRVDSLKYLLEDRNSGR